ATRGLALAAPVGVIDRIHGHAADRRANALPAIAPGLADRLVLVIEVPDLSHRGVAVHEGLAHLPGGQPQQGITALASDQLGPDTRGAGQLAALSGAELDVVQRGAEGNRPHGQGVPGLDVRLRRGHHRLADPQAVRRQDVATLAVGVTEQRDVRRPIRVVLDGLDPRRDVDLVPAEINHAVAPLVAAALVSDCDLTAVVASAGALSRREERLVRIVARSLDAHRAAHESPAGARGLVFLDRHDSLFRPVLRGFEQYDFFRSRR